MIRRKNLKENLFEEKFIQIKNYSLFSNNFILFAILIRNLSNTNLFEGKLYSKKSFIRNKIYLKQNLFEKKKFYSKQNLFEGKFIKKNYSLFSNIFILLAILIRDNSNENLSEEKFNRIKNYSLSSNNFTIFAILIRRLLKIDSNNSQLWSYRSCYDTFRMTLQSALTSIALPINVF